MLIDSLSADTLDAAVRSQKFLVVEFRTPSPSSALQEAAVLRPQIYFAHVDLQSQPATAAVFGLSEGPALAIFRDGIGLYLESADHSAERIARLLDRITELDMDTVRNEIEEQKRAEVALRMRRVCPATRRTQ